MINFERFTLDNGLRVIVHKDSTTPLVAFNLLYDVGARDENPEQTGFAHLFEHLMFGGSVHIPNFDQPIENVGGENNAFTSNDITNFYITVPKENMETAFWLESDRMLSLAFSEKSLETQRSVVIEEFKQNYLNRDSKNIISRLLNRTNELSLDVLNGYVHSDDTYYLTIQSVNRFWDFLFPLFEDILDIREI